MDVAHHRLEAGARGADQADRPAADAVGEAEPDAADDRRAAVRPQHEQALLARLPLERHLALERHVVAVEEDVAAVVERLVRHVRRVAAGNGDQHPARLGELLQGGGQAAGPEVLRRLRRRPHLQQGVDPGQRLARRLLALRLDHDQQVVRTGLRLRRRRPPAASTSRLAGVAITTPASSTPGSAGERALELHQHDRVVVGAGADGAAGDRSSRAHERDALAISARPGEQLLVGPPAAGDLQPHRQAGGVAARRQRQTRAGRRGSRAGS